MGTDINGKFQKQINPGVWVDIETKYKFSRHYQLFAFIGGVRNGYGFVGTTTGQYVNPLAANRGLPSDIVDHAKLDDCDYYFGDHSLSWFHVNEYLERILKEEKVLRTGFISKQAYLEWQKVPVMDSGLRASPSNCSISGGILGKNIITINDNSKEIQDNPHFTHIRIEYEIDLAEEFQYFTDEIKRLIDIHKTDQIRFVFGFDN